MYVWGFSSHRSLAGTRAISPENRDSLRKDAPVVRATSSTHQKPALWRVASYFLPGLPRPTMSFTKERSKGGYGPQLGEGRLRRETVEGFPLFVSAEARAFRRAARPPALGCGAMPVSAAQ